MTGCLGAAPANAPKVTVLLSSFNHADHLRQAIDSVLNQTFTDFELIIIDDASRDSSCDIIQSYADPRIRAIRNSRQIGPVLSACQAITEWVRGEYIAINHSDDAWEPEKLARQCALLDASPELGAVFTWVQVIDENGNRLENDWFSRPDKSRWEWLNELFNEENHLAHPSLLIRKACYETSGLYHSGLMQTPDVDMWCRLLIDWPIQVIPERLTLHRIFTNRANTSSSARPDVRIRTANEWNYVRRHFLRLRKSDEVYRIFPGLAQKFPPRDAENIKFLLAMACLHCSKSPNAWHLGFEWLFELMDEPETRAQLEQAYDFSYPHLMALTRQYDVYGFVERTKLASDYAALSQEFEKSQAEVRRLWDELQKEQREVARLWEVQQKEVAKLWNELQGSHAEAAGLRGDLDAMRADLDAARLEVERIGEERDRLGQELQSTSQQLQGVSQQLERITRTIGYRVLRKGYRLLKTLKVIKND